MYFILGFLIMFIVGWILVKSADEYCDWDLLGRIFTLLGGILLTASLIIWPVEYTSNQSKIEQYQAFRKTVEGARTKDLSELERATILKDVATWNGWIAKTKFYNKKANFDWSIPDEIEEVEPLY